ncbi:alpha/beta hydrolase [Cellulomonas alba]|uniref:Alpha/beta hydrolase n=1 Tax=Cellulomonas alba TaxID=3053467 RepID=A0ABT7SJB6_9CELL|nr:alpha/beta hydrolase [Cellulomonas alba]MDM7856273.1 alpha/beta hydrolase [Cellulomonas alba]
MSNDSTTGDATPRPGWRGRTAFALLRASLLVSPRPAALAIRTVFARTGAQTARVLDRHAPSGTRTERDRRYGEGPDALLDVHRPADAEGPLPLLVWVHGGAFVGGTKDELAGWFRLLASHGYVVAAPRYSLAPGHRYPTPVRQVAAAVRHLCAHADELGIDPARVVLAGDSAGAHIAAQLAAVVTTPGYGDQLAVAAPLTADALRGVVLACGPYDARLAGTASSPAGALLIKATLWAYTGRRDFLEHPAARTFSVPDHVTPRFPATLLTVGNADPLAAHTTALLAALDREGVDVRTLLWPPDHRPALGHEYQFALDTDEAQAFLARLLEFLGDGLGDLRARP